MKKTILSLSLLIGTVFSFANAGIHETEPYEFTIAQADYRFATHYEINSSNTYSGQIKKSAFRVRAHYDLSDSQGWQATGIRRVLSLGAFFSWGAEIDVYDTRGVAIGMIDGQMATTEEAKFSIYEYDEEGNTKLCGIAYLDNRNESFTLYYPEDKTRQIAKFKRDTVMDARDYWKVHVVHPEEIDDRIVRIFAAFAIDTQSQFRMDDVDIPPPNLEDEEMIFYEEIKE